MVSESDFVGTWRLKSWRLTTRDGRVRELFGEAPIGLITYTADGYMSVIFSRSDRPNFDVGGRMLDRCRRIAVGSEQDDPKDAELAAAKDRHFRATMNMYAYAGRLRVDGLHVVHDVEVSALPEWNGIDLPRLYRFEEDRLSLTVEGERYTQELVWQRA